jgi:hypothetical protein
VNCSKLIYYDPYFAGQIYSNQKQHNTAFEANQHSRPTILKSHTYKVNFLCVDLTNFWQLHLSSVMAIEKERLL